MTKSDERLIEASIHYAIAECGGLARISTPYKMDRRTRMGVGFDCCSGGYYSFPHRQKKGSKHFQYLSHRMIYYLHHRELPEFIDHIDGNPLNNSLTNLRAATKSQNGMNRRSRINSSSKYLGVNWVNSRKKWQAQIQTSGKRIHIGRFTCEKEAARAYNKAASEYHGEFANLNVIEGGEE